MVEKSKIGRPPKQIEAVKGRIQNDWIKGKDQGSRLPSQTELCRRYGANPKTIQAVLLELETLGEIVRKPYGRVIVSGSKWVPWTKFMGKFIGFFPYSIRWINDSFARAVYEGVRERLGSTGINVGIPTRTWRLKVAGPYLPPEIFGSVDIAGLILLGVDPLKGFPKPKVLVDADGVAEGVDSFCFDNPDAGRMLARRLLRLGHRRIALIVEDPCKPVAKRDQAWDARRDGVVAALAEGKAPPPVEIAMKIRTKVEEVIPALRPILKMPLPNRPTALVVPFDMSNEIKALAAELKLRIPRDLSIAGFTSLDKETQMTSMRFDGFELGHAATHHLLMRIRDPDWETRKVRLHNLKGRYVAGKTHARAPQPR